MAIKVGDPLFNTQGEPGVVRKKESLHQRMQASSDRNEVKDEFRHGYIAGLDGKDRKTFNAFMDDIRAIDKPDEKIEKLQKKIQEMEKDPTSQANIQLTKYLKSELFHLMQTYNVRPRQFEMSYRENS